VIKPGRLKGEALQNLYSPLSKSGKGDKGGEVDK